MRASARTLVSATLAFLVIASIFASAQTPGLVRGEVTDISDGVLPGVTVVATSADGRILARTFTNDVGRFEIRSLPPGPIRLVFDLDGFERGIIGLVLPPGGESRVVERLKLAGMTEEVVVYGKAPPDPPPPYVPPPRPSVIPVAPQELESVCKPAKPGATLGPFGTVQSHRQAYGRMLYGKGDELVVTGGTRHGLAVGRNLVAVRYFRVNGRADGAAMGEHTAGLVQIVTATEDASTAIVIHSCNEVRQGDLLVAFTPEPARTPDRAGVPAFEDAARILFADAGHMVGAPRRLMVIDQGSDRGIQAGRRLTLFRRRSDLAKPYVLGEAVVVSARTTSATIRIVSATDAIESGDWAAPQGPSPIARQ